MSKLRAAHGIGKLSAWGQQKRKSNKVGRAKNTPPSLLPFQPPDNKDSKDSSKLPGYDIKTSMKEGR